MDSACIAYGAALLAEDGSVPDLSSGEEKAISPCAAFSLYCSAGEVEEGACRDDGVGFI